MRKAEVMTSLLIVLIAVVSYFFYTTRMPGVSFAGSAPVPGPEEEALASELRRHVETLAGEIGSRSMESLAGLRLAEQYLVKEAQATGLAVRRQEYRLESAALDVSNFELELRGSEEPNRVIVVGAHYDTVGNDCPGANDNGTGVAATLVLASRLKDARPKKTVRFLFFVNEEPPYFQTADQGSERYVADMRGKAEKVEAMFALETMGYFSETAGSQRYPFPFSAFYPETGNFIAFVGLLRSASFVRRAVGAFRAHARIPSEGVAAPGFIPGIGWSDHAPFSRDGVPSVMVTDTAPFRYPHYHLPSDTADKIDYFRLALVVQGLEGVIRELAG